MLKLLIFFHVMVVLKYSTIQPDCARDCNTSPQIKRDRLHLRKAYTHQGRFKDRLNASHAMHAELILLFFMVDSVCVSCGHRCLAVLVLGLMAWHTLNWRRPAMPVTSGSFVAGEVIFTEPSLKVTADRRS